MALMRAIFRDPSFLFGKPVTGDSVLGCDSDLKLNSIQSIAIIQFLIVEPQYISLIGSIN